MSEQAQARICPTCYDDHPTGDACALIWEHPFEADDLWPDTCGNVRGRDGFICGFGREVHGDDP